MTHKEENIVNIAMRAAELLKDGKIQRDEISGHAGLTETILFLSEQFEKKFGGVDFDAEGKDYWEEIDDFAEIQLMALYGREVPEVSDLVIDNVHVFAVAGSVRKEIFCGDWDECINFCVEHDWSFLDENEFQWELELVDDREATFPEDYHDAVDYFCSVCGEEIESEYIRQHADYLVTCYQNNAGYRDFIAWNRFEYLLNETLTFEEACALSRGTEIDPFDSSDYDMKATNELKGFLAGYRAAEGKHPSLDTMIHSAANKTSDDTAHHDDKVHANECHR